MFSMQGYGMYVWPSFGVVLVGLAFLMVSSLRQAKQLKKQLREENKYR